MDCRLTSCTLHLSLRGELQNRTEEVLSLGGAEPNLKTLLSVKREMY